MSQFRVGECVSASHAHTIRLLVQHTTGEALWHRLESVSEMRARQREDRSALPTWFASVTEWKDCHMRGQGFCPLPNGSL